ncbi:MAG: radical SAM protein [Candidatus Korarchaeota archaeon]|nr:radical SAM protein [Candidatus Korarchaeota archaeon]NIU84634.1 radical SAM protein [Candidatus Thorarchaeota archaeon]NIW14660.1 radical SAM protein [Candidatus Thorarchaeota archaeon]NIW52736.1 radical SAM protein [Candidatus Korarchaeota archaeon]
MKVTEITAKSIVVRSSIPGIDYVVNPYIGCQHGCKYCYAKFMKRFTDHHEPWGEFVDIKVNAPELVGDKKYEDKLIQFSSVTDPYQPLEAKYTLTQKTLEQLLGAGAQIDILTKSSLVTRDIDLFKSFSDLQVGISLALLGDHSKNLEPRAAPPDKRINALKTLKNAGLKTYVFVSPIFPEISDVARIVDLTAPHVDFLMFENLNLRSTNYQQVMSFLERHDTKLVPLYKEMYQSEELHRYWKECQRRIRRLGEQYETNMQIHFHHGGF